MQYWMTMTNATNFEMDRKANFQFAGYKERLKRLCSRVEIGDKLLYYITESHSFGAICTVTAPLYIDTTPHWSETGEVWPCRLNLRPEVVLPEDKMLDVMPLLPSLSFITQKQRQLGWGTAFMGSLKKIPWQDFELIERRMRRIIGEEQFQVAHRRLLEMLCDIGETLGFIAKTDDETPDKAYRCDVTWRDYEGHSPLKVFQVELSRNIDHALSSLAHALDTWRPEQLYLILGDESDFGRVQKLTEPRLRGAFSRLSHRLKAYPWIEVKRLYDNLRVSKELITRLSKR